MDFDFRAPAKNRGLNWGGLVTTHHHLRGQKQASLPCWCKEIDMIDDLIIVVIIININLLCIFSLAVHFLFLLFWTKRSMQISKQTIQCEKKTSSFHWFDFISKHLDLRTFVIFCFWNWSVGYFFLKIACQVMKTEFHPWSMEAQEKESGDNQYNLGIGNWNWNDKTLKRKQKEEWSREGVKSQQKKRGQNLRKGVKIWEKGLESEKKRSKSEKKGSKSGWPSDHSLAASVAIFASPPCLLNSHIMILYPGPGIRFSKRTFDIFVPGQTCSQASQGKVNWHVEVGEHLGEV